MLRVLMLGLLLTSATVTAAAANDFCNQEMAPLVKERDGLQARMAEINKNAKKPGAREAFCGTIGKFVDNMRKTTKYMTDNKEFCQIPDAAITAVETGLKNAITARKRVCSAPVAAQGEGGNAAAGPAIPKPPVELRLQ